MPRCERSYYRKMIIFAGDQMGSYDLEGPYTHSGFDGVHLYDNRDGGTLGHYYHVRVPGHDPCP